MKNWKQCTLMVLMVLFVFTFIGCGDTCSCKDLYIVLTGEKCNKDGCVSVEIPGVRSTVTGKATNNMPITNRNNALSSDDFDTMVTRVNTALDRSELESTGKQAYIKNNIKEIRIVPLGGGVSILNGIYTIEMGTTAGGIRGELEDLLDENEIE